MNDDSIVKGFISEHKEGLGLMALALASALPPELPYPFNKVEALSWVYKWFRSGILTFVSMRGPAHIETQQTTDRTIKRDDDGSVTATTKTVSSAASTAPVVEEKKEKS